MEVSGGRGAYILFSLFYGKFDLFKMITIGSLVFSYSIYFFVSTYFFS